ncbi:elongation factor P maturation arginine rhamnosyltransferase EarP [Pseudomonas sp. GV071]|uniref:elongation factor P maturation arginine rhamnosyltransferase EarP n=1 Tax=Pseudomonas sp. GV071 TaxID=2135754 RepID=UPI000D383B84|nr:elongation factor P maturation arginine rhamnosyltransferase EarP [Pseudomonas sp. GV071]PTQ74057.1 putative repeat protein (TIGR03837 family) [Pseudomonas sp. GV071]
MKWDIFCSVVDNFGDIGVTWRLARQLVAEQGCAVRLWVDELSAFARICPQADATLEQQWQEGVEVCQWPTAWQPVAAADVVIEAFACSLPPAYITAMAERARASLWLNLEYLSAEDWVEGCHGLPSMQSNGLQKFFFFPGFTAGTGGLLREGKLLAARDELQQHPRARSAFLASLGVTPEPNSQLISLFAYENLGLGEWLGALADASTTSHLLVPEGRVLGDVERWLGESLTAGDVRERGALRVQILPFVAQQTYDRLLWCCDFNAVRGEDSFVRALWAGRPLVWHIYKQDEDAHLDKLQAFLALYQQGLSPAAQTALSQFWLAWNSGEGVAASWVNLQRLRAELVAHAEKKALQWASQADLATALVQFYRNWLSYAA